MLEKLLRDALAEGTNARQTPSLKLLREVWPTLLGEPLCHRTRPVAWREKTLVIGAASEAWRRELARNHRQLHARLHRLLPWPLDELRFTVQQMDPPPAPVEPASPPAVEAPTIKDPDLQADLDRLDEGTRALALRILGHVEREKSE